MKNININNINENNNNNKKNIITILSEVKDIILISLQDLIF